MADRGSNGLGGKLIWAPGTPPPGMPADPGAAPPMVNGVDYGVPAPPVEHQTPAPGPIPQTTSYEGGGIFPDSTLGPSFESVQSEHPGSAASEPRGLDFGPVMADGPPGHMLPPGPMGMPVPYGAGQLPAPQESSLGLTLLAVATGAVLGVKYGGPYGGVAGSLLGGAAVNAYRAFRSFRAGTEGGDREARVSGTYALGAGAIGAVIWHKLAERPEERATPNRRSSPRGDDVSMNPCAIRPAGP